MVRLILAILAGTLVAFVIVAAWEAMLQAIVPASRVPTDPGEMRTFVARQPIGLLAGVVAGWTLAAVVGTAIGAHFARRGRWPGWVVGALFLAATIANFLMIPHPMWMIAAGVLLVVAAIWIGTRLGTGDRVLAPRAPA